MPVREYIPEFRHAYSGLRGFSTCSTKKKRRDISKWQLQFKIFLCELAMKPYMHLPSFFRINVDFLNSIPIVERNKEIFREV